MTLATAEPFAVAAWTLDEASGTRADSVGSNNLADNNTVGSASGLFSSNAADFERDNSEYLSAADSATLSTGDVDFTLRCLINPEAVDLSTRIFAKIGTSHGEFNSRINSSGVVEFTVYGSSGFGNTTTVTASTFGALSIGTWYLLHFWHDSVNNEIGVSVNGVADTAAHSAGVFDSAEDFQIGAQQPYGEFFDGLIQDAVFLKNYVLDSTERSEDYNSGSFTQFADWDAGGGGGAVIPALDEGMLVGGLQSLSGGLQ